MSTVHHVYSQICLHHSIWWSSELNQLPCLLCRFTVQETVQLLADLGLRDGSAFETNGITGGDLLELDNSELREDLGLTNLQVLV